MDRDLVTVKGLHVVRLTSTHSKGSGTQCIDWRRSLLYFKEFPQEINLRQVWGYSSVPGWYLLLTP